MRNLVGDLLPGNETISIASDSQSPETDPSLNEFFQITDKAQENFKQMRELLKSIRNLHNHLLATPTEDVDAKNQLSTAMENFKQKAKYSKQILDQISSRIKEDEKIAQSKPTVLQIEKNQHFNISRDLNNLMTEYSTVQSLYRENLTKRIERQAAIAGKTVTYEELEELIESGNITTFIDQVAATEKSKKTLMEIEQRHNEILNLEKNLRELHDLFTDLSLLVDQQDDLIDRIDHNVDQALNYVKKGEVQLQKAAESKRKNIKLKIGIGVGVSLVIIIIIIIIAVQLS